MDDGKKRSCRLTSDRLYLSRVFSTLLVTYCVSSYVDVRLSRVPLLKNKARSKGAKIKTERSYFIPLFRSDASFYWIFFLLLGPVAKMPFGQ